MFLERGRHVGGVERFAPRRVDVDDLAAGALRHGLHPAAEVAVGRDQYVSPGSTTFPIAASIDAEPVPETGIVHWLSVRKVYRRRSCTSSMISMNDGSRWPTSGVLIARRTRGWTSLGPGPISVRPVVSTRLPWGYPCVVVALGVTKIQPSRHSMSNGPLITGNVAFLGANGFQTVETVSPVYSGHGCRAGYPSAVLGGGIQ